MMQFFRKYQRIFFIFLTAIIVVSFSFFGTYSALASNEVPDPVLFTDVGGNAIKRSHVDLMMRFIGTDAQDKLTNGGIFGPNFLNDGVIRKDFLENGLALLLTRPFEKELSGDLETRKERQKTYSSYVHPYANFVSAENAWNFFAPTIAEKLHWAKGDDQDFFENQVALYLEEQKFPQTYLKQVLRYQESETKDLPRDPYLTSSDLSLFGYHTVEDWFGSKFLQLASEVIINSSTLAKQRGIVVSDEEALAELLYNNELSYKQLKEVKSPHLLVRNASEYFREQLRILGMDQKAAIDTWKHVIAFRKLISSISAAVFVDDLTYNQYQKWADKVASVKVYDLKDVMRFTNSKELAKFETYLQLVAEPKKDLLDVPNQFKKVSEMAPELVQKKYEVTVASVDANDVQMRVPLKEIWSWELESANWAKLLVKSPKLGTALTLSREQRLQALDALDDNSRLVIDLYARGEILKSHPEWIDEALEQAQTKKISFGIRGKGASIAALGIKNPKALQELLDKNDTLALSRWSEDSLHYFRFTEVVAGTELEPLTFQEALQDRTLDILVERNKIDFKPLHEAIVLDAQLNGHPWSEESGLSQGDFAASYRFYKYVRDVHEQIALDDDSQVILARRPFLDQFKIQSKNLTVARNDPSQLYDTNAFFETKEGDFSKVLVIPKIDAYFFQVIAFKEDDKSTSDLMKRAQNELGKIAAIEFMKEELKVMSDKKALHLDV